MVKNLPANAGDVRDMGLIPGSRRCPGEENGNPLQYLCLENPMDRGAWGSMVRSIAKSQTQLKWFSTHACTHTHTHTEPIIVTCAHQLLLAPWPSSSHVKKLDVILRVSVFLHPSIHLFSPQALIEHLGEASGWCWVYTNEQDKHHPYPHGVHHLHREMDMNQTDIQVFILNETHRKFPDTPVAETLLFHYQGLGSISSWRTKILQAAQYGQKKKN